MVATPKMAPMAIPAIAPSPSLEEVVAAGDIVVRAVVDVGMAVIAVVLGSGAEFIVVLSTVLAEFGKVSYVTCTLSMLFIVGWAVGNCGKQSGKQLSSYGGRL